MKHGAQPSGKLFTATQDNDFCYFAQLDMSLLSTASEATCLASNSRFLNTASSACGSLHGRGFRLVQ